MPIKPIVKTKQKWEYLAVRCTELEIQLDQDGDQAEYGGSPKLTNPIPLDPNLNLPKGTRVTRDLAWSVKNNQWTYISTALNELGDEGWELIASTPQWSSSNNVAINQYYFDLIVKRPKHN